MQEATQDDTHFVLRKDQWSERVIMNLSLIKLKPCTPLLEYV